MKKSIVVTVFIAAFFYSLSVHASQVLAEACTIDKLYDDSGIVFCGEVTKVDVDTNARTIVANAATTYTFKVLENGCFKGDCVGKETVSFKTPGLPPTYSRAEQARASMIGVPHYSVGQKVCLFLSAPANTTGFQTPMGLNCGWMDLKKDQDGKESVRPNISRRTLFRDINTRRPAFVKSLNTREKAIVAEEDQAMSLDDFRSILMKLRDGGKHENIK